MPTPSEPFVTAGVEPLPDCESSARSVFGNYQATGKGIDSDEASADAATSTPRRRGTAAPPTLQHGIDEGMARSFLYRYLAQVFDYPDADVWGWINEPATIQALRLSATALAGTGEGVSLTTRVETTLSSLCSHGFERFQDDHVAAFGHGARGSCPINEIEYGDLKADPLFQPHRLADLGAFYRAFGLVVSDGGERHDHVAVELEFMAVLTLREAHALEHQLGHDEWLLNREAAISFMHDHIGRWTPAFSRRVARALPDSPMRACADLLLAAIENDCRRLELTPGSEDLLLRPVDAVAESMCSGCGLDQTPPGGDTVTNDR